MKFFTTNGTLIRVQQSWKYTVALNFVGPRDVVEPCAAAAGGGDGG